VSAGDSSGDEGLPVGPAFEDPRKTLRRHGLAPKRGYSQNFLVARHAVEKIAEAIAVGSGEPVVELGPGLGTLTGALLRRGGRVLAIERDPDMRRVLAAELGGYETFEVRDGDAATVDLSALANELGGPLAVVGNLPYAITGAIFRNLQRYSSALDRAVLMIQREVRERLCASPGGKAYGALTVFVTSTFTVEPVLSVRPGSFFPAPKVDSAVVRLRPRAEPLLEETEHARRIVRAVFDARRKTLRNALLRGAGASADQVDAALADLQIDPRCRGETLSPAQFDALAKRLARG
jgi:16S rRNA (adenine1518-N6/adenine1519-N6)-dimethyltransferase